MEKELVTPDSYPLTLRALISACNQTTSRFPVVDYAETLVDTTLHALKAKGLVRFVHPSHGERVTKYRQVMTDESQLDHSQHAVIALLLLRGAQTASELKTRSERMCSFSDNADVESTLQELASRQPPMVTRIPRQPGQKGDRWIQLLEVDPDERAGAGLSTDGPTTSTTTKPSVESALSGLEERVARLERQIRILADALGEDLDEMVGGPDQIETDQIGSDELRSD